MIDGTVKLSSQDTEKYMAKFSFSPRQLSRIEGTFDTELNVYFDNHPHELTLCLYNEQGFEQFQFHSLR